MLRLTGFDGNLARYYTLFRAEAKCTVRKFEEQHQ